MEQQQRHCYGMAVVAGVVVVAVMLVPYFEDCMDSVVVVVVAVVGREEDLEEEVDVLELLLLLQVAVVDGTRHCNLCCFLDIDEVVLVGRDRMMMMVHVVAAAEEY